MLACRDLSAEWDTDVMTVDTLGPLDIAAMGRHNERWRFSAEHESSLAPRDSAFASALRGGVTCSPPTSEIPPGSFPEIPKS
eukprot:12949163-Heterocapsa_arctica.AAC.1